MKDELNNSEAPITVRNWIAAPPQWLEIQHANDLRALSGLGAGETEAIALALELHADLLLMDDRRGVKAARGKGIEVTGTLAVLGLAGKRGLLNLVSSRRQTFATRRRSWTSSSTESRTRPGTSDVRRDLSLDEIYFFAAGASIAGTLAS